jgi:RES domain-containing protein
MGLGWRLVRDRYASSAFSGEGARRFGGRWNSPGTPVVYTSAHLSLASLETLVHVQPLTLQDLFAVFEVEWKDSLMETLADEDLPRQWNSEPPGAATMRLGDQWIQENRCAVLSVPSVLVPEERNYLLNPRHADFSKIKIRKRRSFMFDPRFQI